MKPVIIIAIAFVLLIPIPIFAESQTLPTSKGTLDVKLTHEQIKPGVESKIIIDFINPFTGNIQEHIDYTIAVSKDGERVFGPIPLTHTSVGSIKIPIEFNLGEGVYSMDFEVEGILFQPIPIETVSFDIPVGDTNTPLEIPSWVKNNVKWWANGQINDSTFVSGIEFLISEEIIDVPITQKSVSTTDEIPSWVRTNAKWWADGVITDSDFVKGIEYLVNSGIISVKQTTQTQMDSPSLEIDAGPSDDIETQYELCSGYARCITGIVTQVIDGDTIKIDGQSVRFAMASAPELDEVGGIESKEFIETICSVGSIATVDEDDGQTQGSYGRIIGVIHCNGFNLNSDLLDYQYGYLITDFCSDSEFANEPWAQKHGCSTDDIGNNCPSTHPYLWSDGFCYTESEYADNGCPRTHPYLWSDGRCYTASEFLDNGCPQGYPYIWSDGLCYNLPEPVYDDTPKCDPSYPDFCLDPNSRDLDCDEIPYSNFRVYQPDPHRFDADHDGIGCETYSPPKPTPPPVESTTADCDPSYPTVCIPPYPPDLNCGDIPYKRFTVLPPDPHGFDRDKDGIGCES